MVPHERSENRPTFGMSERSPPSVVSQLSRRRTRRCLGTCNRCASSLVHDCVKTGLGPATSAAEEITSWIGVRGPWLVRCAYLLTSDRDAALDLAQETLERVWVARDRVVQIEDRDAYVLRIMLNRLRDQKRRRAPGLIELAVLTTASTSDATTVVDEVDAVMRAVSTLSHRQRAVLVMRYWGDLDDTEIAAVLGCRRSTVRSLAARGLSAVRVHMKENP